MVISPLTNESQVSLLDEIPTSRLVADWNNTFSIDITKEFKDCSTIELYRCDKTGLKFFMPSTVAGSDNLYVQLQKFDWYYMPGKWEHAIALTSMQHGGRILEVGCG
ncbi:MAG: class I SAM-dependent methyltransferase, partial [Deltaproteobacteria bacterium]|nr:class I SAM-dependent methyltransferase [Deltaproteobacteria bacterium]